VGPGYDGRLFLLAADDRGEDLVELGVDPADAAAGASLQRLIVAGVAEALAELRVPASDVGMLVGDPQSAAAAVADGLVLTVPVEAVGTELFDFADGEAFGEHITALDPVIVKAALRWNPSDAPDVKKTQARRLARLAAWSHETGRRLLCEVHVPATSEDLAEVGGDPSRYVSEVQPDLAVKAVREIRDLGIEPDLWAVEGVAERAHAAELSDLVRDAGRDDVVLLALAREVDPAGLPAATEPYRDVPAAAGVVLGRSLWADHVRAHLAGDAEEAATVALIATEVRRAIEAADAVFPAA
jgi:myo-inositol catabolism protein IolC